MYNYYFNSSSLTGNIYTDLACERGKADVNKKGIEFEKHTCPVGSWERVTITNESTAKSIGRPCGIYDTLNLSRLDLLDDDDIDDAKEEIAKKLCRICDDIAVMPARILVAGFGNEKMTADSIGPKSACRVKPTLHIRVYEEDFFDSLECSEIAVFCPDVSAHSGMDSSKIIKAICNEIMPDVIIAIDSIMTNSTSRLGTTIQISDTGLFPGGCGNLKSPITRNVMEVPVIGIGVPTVMDIRNFSPEIESDPSAGLFYVSPREIDEITDAAAKIIGGGINQAFGLTY